MPPLRRPALLVWLSSLVILAPLLPGADPSPPPVAPPPARGPAVTSADADTPAPTEKKPDPAEEKFWQAVKLFRSPKPDDLAAGRALLQEAADLEYSHAQVLLGNCLLSGSYGFKTDARKGAGIFRVAAARGNAYAQTSLGQCHFFGTGVSKDAATAAGFLEAAVRPDADYSRPNPPADFFQPPALQDPANDTAGELATDPAAATRASAHFLLGLIAQQRGDMARAHPHFEAAATAGLAGHSGIYPAAVQTSLDYAFGQGVPRDMAKATAMLELSRKLGVRATLTYVHSNVALKIASDLASAEVEEQMTKALTEAQQEIQLGIARSLADR